MEMHPISYLMIASFVILASCSNKTDLPAGEADTPQVTADGIYELNKNQFESSGMKLGGLEMKTFHEVVKANGMFDVPPGNQASVSTYFGGSVIEISLLPGERVRKGQVLFVLENPAFVEMQQEFLEAKGQLAYLKSDYERQKNLVQDRVSSQKNFLKAESDYMVTMVRVESLGKQLALMNIDPNALSMENITTRISVKSPISGYVTEVGVTKGAFLNPSQSAISIVNTDHIHLELDIFEKDLARVEIGQPIKFRIQEDSSRSYEAVVHLVNRTVDPESRTIGIHGHLSDEKLSTRFNPGMYVESDIYVDTETKVSLPQNALVELDGKYYVLVLRESSNSGYLFSKREVEVGLSSDQFIEIVNAEDFDENAEFLTTGAFNLLTE